MGALGRQVHETVAEKTLAADERGLITIAGVDRHLSAALNKFFRLRNQRLGDT